MPQTLPARVSFAEFELDLKTGELRGGGKTVRLAEKPFRVLLILVEGGGELISREELQKRLWPGDTVVDFEHGINTAIKRLRQALGDSADEPKYIETIPRRGYRLMVRVEWIRVADGDPPADGSDVGTQLELAGLIGKKVSHYRVLGVIGGGGMGLVFKAEDLKLGRQVALKFLPEELAWDPAALQRFEREARTASSLDHPNICTIYEVEEHEEQPFLVMQLLEGETLRDRLARASAAHTPLPFDEALDIALQVLAGLGAAHHKGIIHRDIKPANIFMTSSGQVKILDFGLAKLVSASKDLGSDGLHLDPLDVGGATPRLARPAARDETITRLGTAMGTAGYMSPEQIRGEKLDARTDLFSFGLVLYEMFAGQRAFSGDTAAIVQDAILNNFPLRLRALNPALPPGLEAVINRALEKDRDLRYQSVAELVSELQPLSGEANSARATAETRSTPRWALWAAASLVGVLAVLAVAMVLWRRTGPPTELKEVQLTANPLDDEVISAAISPDGKHVAYQDQTGFYLRSIDSGETRLITLPAELSGRIGHLCWFPSGEKLLADVDGSNGELDTWIITILGGAEPHLLYRHGVATGISPDGKMIAFTTGELARQWKAVWVGGLNGEAPRKLVTAGEQESVTSPVWSPDGRWIAYGRIWKTPQGPWSSDIEVRPAGGGTAKTLVAESGLSESNTLRLAASPWFVGSWSPDWRLLFTVANSAASGSIQPKYSVWQVRVDPHTGGAAGKPGQLTEWSEFTPRDLTITSDGKRMALLRERSWLNVYLGDLDGASLKTPRRLTLDDRGSEASAWTHNGEAVLFGSSRNGRQEIFSQRLNENIAEKVVSAPGDVYGVQVSPDGSWFLYWESESVRPAAGTSADSVRLMRRAVGGGPPEMVLQLRLDAYGLDDFWCSSNPQAGSPCVLGLLEGKNLIFYSLDPLGGKGRQVGEIKVFGAYMGWALSFDGSRIALVDGDQYEGRIEVLTLSDGSWHEIAPDLAPRHLQSIAWAADGKSFFATSYAPNSYNLLHVTLTGKVEALLRDDRREWLVSPLPSPDGRYLAFRAETSDSNVWVIDNF